MQEVYEKLGLFYLGKDVDKETQQPTEILTLLKNKSFTTHAAIIGMTGSGKTGLGVALIEEAAIDNIPAIVIDPLGKPPAEIMEESDTLISYLKSAASSLLALIGEDTDSLDTPEYILVAQILMHAWTSDEEMDIAKIIGQIINPPFKKIGVLPLEDFFPQKKRFSLATRFNALLASPSFSLWLEGEELDIKRYHKA